MAIMENGGNVGYICGAKNYFPGDDVHCGTWVQTKYSFLLSNIGHSWNQYKEIYIRKTKLLKF